ncbi:DUF3093 family protein [Streptomyces sp. NPDC058052]|uniref:DUF3093 family protein n=1 Tax=Streptomyces sp. NPDC058052 TaxID=3346316 RepID=UPI0036F12F2E
MTPGGDVSTTYDERLTAPRAYGVIAALIGLAAALIVFPYDVLMRSFVPHAVRVEVVDQADPTPYLCLSTRAPEALKEAVAAARRA